jgi:hypothetical protein
LKIRDDNVLELVEAKFDVMFPHQEDGKPIEVRMASALGMARREGIIELPLYATLCELLDVTEEQLRFTLKDYRWHASFDDRQFQSAWRRVHTKWRQADMKKLYASCQTSEALSGCNTMSVDVIPKRALKIWYDSLDECWSLKKQYASIQGTVALRHR